MGQSVRVPREGRIHASTEKLFGRVPKNSRISVSIENGRIRASTGKMWNPCKYRKTVRTSTEKLFGRVPKNGRICVSTGKWYNPDKHLKKVEFVVVSKNCQDEYRKMIELV